MKKRLLAAVLAIACAGLIVSTAATASATPTKTSRCTGCHSGPAVAVTATFVSNGTTGATYNVSAPTATAFAVFDGTTKIGASVIGTSGQIVVPFGKTYTIYAIQGPTNSDGIGSTTVSPVAPTPSDTTAPTTTSNVKATYVTSAAITLTAVDNAGGSGVAHTYYILDGAAQAEGLTVGTSAVGSHTLSFWSVDVAGNIEAATNASFEVTATPVVTTQTCTIDSKKAMTRHGRGTMRLTGTFTPGQVGDHAYLYVQKPGSHRWIRVATITAGALNGNGGATWSYSYTMNVRGTYHFQVRLAPTTSESSDTHRQMVRD